ncbi:MAG: hypothetical protein K6G45_06280 [Lachnospiraceae bacterium]|nr:hypothetical protein [Lachnospiraceae bacterium]
MKTGLTRIAKVLLTLVMCAAILFSAMPASQASAAKMTNKKAQKILKKKIKNKFCKYTFVDIDNDKIDEMIVLGFSGKFVQGDDKKKTLTVYKVVGKKAKSVLTYAREGNFFHPDVSFNIYNDGDFYITVNDEQEGPCVYTTYVFGAEEFNQIAMYEYWSSDNEENYYLRNKGGLKICSEEEYNEYMAGILENEVEYELQSCSTKVANKYLKKQLMAEFKYLCETEVYDEDIVSPVYSDEDGNGIDELIVRKGPLGGDILYVQIPEGNSAFYIVNSYEYSFPGKPEGVE